MQLVINKYGASLSVKNDMFYVGVDNERHSIPVSKVSSILINKSASLTSNALFLAIENEIEVILILKTGEVVGRIWSPKYGSISNIRKNQVAFSKSAEASSWIKKIIKHKIENQQVLILSLQKYDLSNKKFIEKQLTTLDKAIKKLNVLPNNNIIEIAPQIRSIEGRASKCYFNAINNNLPNMYKFTKRSQHPALDMFNAQLNYAYGMLYNHVERALIMAGIDPYLGIFHRNNYNKPVLVYDLIEKYRVWADFVVVDLCMQKVMFPDFFDTENNVWLLNESGKRILITAINNYMEEKVLINALERSRKVHIELEAQSFAQQLKVFKINSKKL